MFFFLKKQIKRQKKMSDEVIFLFITHWWLKIFSIFNNFSIYRNIYCYKVTINIEDYDFIQI